jgi:hypothetical protein
MDMGQGFIDIKQGLNVDEKRCRALLHACELPGGFRSVHKSHHDSLHAA